MNWDIGVTDDLAACHKIRRLVFIEEQGIPEHEEWDDLDRSAIHMLATVAGQPVGSQRLLLIGPAGWIGRVCIVKEMRGKGLGADLVKAGINRLRKNQDLQFIRLGAQAYCVPFYEALGFTVSGPEYDDGGIPHHEMEMKL